MIDVDITLTLDLPLGALDNAEVEHAIHEALRERGVPVVDVAIEGQRDAFDPIQNPGLPAPFNPALRAGPLGPQQFGRQL